MDDLSKRLRDAADAVQVALGRTTLKTLLIEAADALPQWKPISEAPAPGGDFRVNYSPGFGPFISVGDGHHYHDVSATHFMHLPSPPEDV